MIYNSIPYFPTQVNLFEEVSMELIEAKYGMKAETAVMKLICKIYKENGYYRLQPENDSMDPIIIHGDIQILGKVFGVFRVFQ